MLSSRALKTDKGDTRVLATCVLPLPFPWMVRAGLGRDRVHQTEFKRGKLEVLVERIYAKKVIGKRTESPTGELAREAVLALLERGSLFRKVIQNSRIRFDRWKLAEALQEKGLENFGITPLPDSDFAHWLSRKVHSLGIESGEDLELLSDSDFEIPELDSWTLEQLDRSYPYEVKAGDGIFEAQYDLPRRKVRLVKRSGKKNELPPLSYLPRFQGFGIEVEDRGKVRQLRGRQ